MKTAAAAMLLAASLASVAAPTYAVASPASIGYLANDPAPPPQPPGDAPPPPGDAPPPPGDAPAHRRHHCLPLLCH